MSISPMSKRRSPAASAAPKSPIGNLVQTQTGAPPLLTSIVSNDGIYADFDVDEQTYLNNVRAHAKHAATRSKRFRSN